MKKLKKEDTAGNLPDMKKRVKELEQECAALQKSEEKFRTVFEASSSAIMLLDDTGFFDCNGATLKIFGCKTCEEFLGRHPSEWSPPMQQDGRNSREAAEDKIATAFREGYNHFEWTHVRADKEEFPIPDEKKNKVRSIIDKETPESVGYIDASVTKMDSLLSGLLRLSRTGKAELAEENIDMNRLVSDVVATLEHRFKDSGTKYEISELPECMGDPKQINQVFTNLIGNALKYLDPSRPGAIKIFSEKEGAMTTYCIEDNGIGISADNQGKIFELFQQLDSEKEGEGLGLNIVKKIIERHGGKVWVESEEGRGSKFCISLPQKK